MKNIKAFALAALTAATAIATPAVKAAPVHSALVDSLIAAGVRLYNADGTDLCKVKPDGSFGRGVYNRASNSLFLCFSNGTAEDVNETLTHEAVHVIQDCKAGGIGTADDTFIGNWKTLIPGLKPSDRALIENYYEAKDWGYEVEAYYFQYYPQSVLSTLNSTCL